MATISFTVLKPMLHDKFLRRAGQTIQLEEKHAASLIDEGSVKPADDEQPAAPTAASLSKLTKDGLIALAAEHSIELPADAKKDAIVELLLASGKLAA